jgi:hypothetical protein
MYTVIQIKKTGFVETDIHCYEHLLKSKLRCLAEGRTYKLLFYIVKEQFFFFKHVEFARNIVHCFSAVYLIPIWSRYRKEGPLLNRGLS